MDGPWTELGTGGSSRLMIFELDTIINDSAIFHIEYEDNAWSNWSGYNISTGDLDNDGLKEIYTVGYNYFHLIIHENSGEDTYEYQTDFYVCSEQYQRANQGIVVADIDNNGINELFCATSGLSAAKLADEKTMSPSPSLSTSPGNSFATLTLPWSLPGV